METGAGKAAAWVLLLHDRIARAGITRYSVLGSRGQGFPCAVTCALTCAVTVTSERFSWSGTQGFPVARTHDPSPMQHGSDSPYQSAFEHSIPAIDIQGFPVARTHHPSCMRFRLQSRDLRRDLRRDLHRDMRRDLRAESILLGRLAWCAV
jgi:hypothetical protein